jgi:hypothetical protein
MFSDVVVTTTGTLRASIARVRPTMLCFRVRMSNIPNAGVQADLMIDQE